MEGSILEWYWWVATGVIGLGFVSFCLFYMVIKYILDRENKTLLFISDDNTDDIIKLFGRPLLEIEMMFISEYNYNNEYIGCVYEQDYEKHYSLIQTYVDEQYSQKSIKLKVKERRRITNRLERLAAQILSGEKACNEAQGNNL